MMQPVTERLLGGLSTIGVPVRRMQKICPQGRPAGQTELHSNTVSAGRFLE